MAMTKRYTTVNGQIIFAENVGTPGKSMALVPDTLGNVIANKDVNGDIVREAEYWPYGEIRTETDSNPTPFGYGGTWGYYSDPSGMLYVRARYYRPIEGRWLTVDPLWPEESAYGYVDVSPSTRMDPSGNGYIINCSSPVDAKAIRDAISSIRASAALLDSCIDVYCNKGTKSVSPSCISNFLTKGKGVPVTISCIGRLGPSSCTQRGSGKDCSYRDGSEIVLCANILPSRGTPHPNCSLECALIHELIHVCGAQHKEEGGVNSNKLWIDKEDECMCFTCGELHRQCVGKNNFIYPYGTGSPWPRSKCCELNNL